MNYLLKRFGFLEFSASNVVLGPMQWGPVRKVAQGLREEIPGWPTGDEASNVTDTGTDEMEEHLRGLGCLE